MSKRLPYQAVDDFDDWNEEQPTRQRLREHGSHRDLEEDRGFEERPAKAKSQRRRNREQPDPGS